MEHGRDTKSDSSDIPAMRGWRWPAQEGGEHGGADHFKGNGMVYAAAGRRAECASTVTKLLIRIRKRRLAAARGTFPLQGKA